MVLIRDVSAEMQTALQSDSFFPVILVSLDWPDAPVFVHSGVGVLVHGGEDWIGVGDFGSIQLPQEAPGVGASEATLQLLGLPPEIIERIDGDPIRNRAVRVLFGCVTARAGNVLVGNPTEVFAGYMDSAAYKVSVSGDEILHGVELRVATGPSASASGSVVHSYEDQISAYPGDTFGALLINVEAEAAAITWPET